MRIRIQDGHLNADPCGSVSEILLLSFTIICFKYYFSACAKGSCQIELYDFWHNPPPPPPVRQRAPSLIQTAQRISNAKNGSGAEEEEAVCENCIRRIVKILGSSPVRSAGAPEAQEDEKMAEVVASGPDSICLLPDIK